jgi:DNA-binding NarL/FixJ family response regulator
MQLGMSESKLSQLELVALKMVAEGSSFDDVASALGLCRVDVERLMDDAVAKLNAKSRLHAISIAVHNGLIDS